MNAREELERAICLARVCGWQKEGRFCGKFCAYVRELATFVRVKLPELGFVKLGRDVDIDKEEVKHIAEKTKKLLKEMGYVRLEDVEKLYHPGYDWVAYPDNYFRMDKSGVRSIKAEAIRKDIATGIIKIGGKL